MESKLLDTKYAIDSGADEIDIVINRKAFLEGDFRKVFDEIVALKEVCNDVHLKTILEVGDLKTYENKSLMFLAVCQKKSLFLLSTY